MASPPPAIEKRTTRGDVKAKAARLAALAGPAEGKPEVGDEEAVAPKATTKRKRTVAKKDQPAPEPRATANKKKAPVRGRKTLPVGGPEDDDVLPEVEPEGESPAPPKKQKKTPAAKAAAKPARAAATKRRPRGATKKAVEASPEEVLDGEDVMEIDNDQDMVDAQPPGWATDFQTNFLGVFTTSINTLESRVDTRIETLGTKFNEMDVKFGAFGEHINAKLEAQTTSIAADLDTKLEGQTDSITRKFDTKFEELSGQVQVVANQLKETEKKLQQHAKDIARNDQAIKITDRRVDEMAKEVEKLTTNLKELMDQAYRRDQGDTHHEETKILLNDLYNRTQNEFEAVLDEFEALKSMVRNIESQTRTLVQQGDEDSYVGDDYDSDRDGHVDDDNENYDSDSNDDTGNGGPGTVGAEHSKTVQDESENIDDTTDSVAQQLLVDFRAAARMAASNRPQVRPHINIVEVNGDQADYGDTTLESGSPAGELRDQQGAAGAQVQDQAGEVEHSKPGRRRTGNARRPRVALSPNGDITQDITSSGAAAFNLNLPSLHMGGQTSNVAPFVPARAASNYQVPAAHAEGEDTDFDENELSGTSTPLQTPLVRQNRDRISTDGSQKHLSTPSAKRPRDSLLQQSVKRNAQRKYAAHVEDAADFSVAPSPAPASADGISDIEASFDVTAYVNDASSPVVARESPRSYAEMQKRLEKEEQKRREKEEDAEDGNNTTLDYGTDAEDSDAGDFGAPNASAVNFTP